MPRRWSSSLIAVLLVAATAPLAMPVSAADAQSPGARLFNGWSLSPAGDLGAVNPDAGPLADASDRLDLSAADRADPAALNAILWRSLAPGVEVPAPVRSVYVSDVTP